MDLERGVSLIRRPFTKLNEQNFKTFKNELRPSENIQKKYFFQILIFLHQPASY